MLFVLLAIFCFSTPKSEAKTFHITLPTFQQKTVENISDGIDVGGNVPHGAGHVGVGL